MNLIKRKSCENEYKVSQGKCRRDKTSLAVSITIRNKTLRIAIFWVAEDDNGNICVACIHLTSIGNGQPSAALGRWAKALLLAPVSIPTRLFGFIKRGFPAQRQLEMLQKNFFNIFFLSFSMVLHSSLTVFVFIFPSYGKLEAI